MSEFEFDAPDIDAPDIDTDISGLSDTPAEGLEDVADTPDLPDDFYHAEHMSDEEVKRIDEMWDESREYSDVEPYKAISSGELSDVEDVALTDEEKFAAEIESMSLDELQAERDRLEELSKMSDMDIFEEYDKGQSSSCSSEQFAQLLDGLSKEELVSLRDGLKSRDPAALEYFGIDDDDDEGPELVLKRTR